MSLRDVRLWRCRYDLALGCLLGCSNICGKTTVIKLVVVESLEVASALLIFRCCSVGSNTLKSTLDDAIYCEIFVVELPRTCQGDLYVRDLQWRRQFPFVFQHAWHEFRVDSVNYRDNQCIRFFPWKRNADLNTNISTTSRGPALGWVPFCPLVVCVLSFAWVFWWLLWFLGSCCIHRWNR